LIAAPILLPLLAFLTFSALGMGETYPPRHRKTMPRTITAAQLQQQHEEWMRQRDTNWELVPVIARVWHPPTLSFEMRPTMKWQRKDSVQV
jgi:hypothetical protein